MLEKILLAAKGAAGKAVDVVGNALGNPLPETGWSERAEAEGAAALPQDVQVQKVQNDPRFSSAYQSSSNTLYPSKSQVANQPTYVNDRLTELRSIPEKDLNPAQRTELNKLNEEANKGGGGGIDFNALLEAQRARARSVYDEGMRRAAAAYERARGIYDESMGTLGTRRAQFKDVYDTGNENILNSYEGERGNLQAAAAGNATRSANALRALGLGGSAMFKSEGSQRQNNMKSLGALNTERAANEKENLSGYNENQLWANTQEAAIQRALNDAAELRTAAENQAGLIEAGDVDTINQNMAGYLDKIITNQMALSAANEGVNSKTVNPYAVNISDLASSLNAALPTLSNTATANDANVSIDPNNYLLSNLYKKQKSALYA